MDDLEVRSLTNRDLALSLRFAVMCPTDQEALLVIKESVRRLETLPDGDKK